MTDDELLGEVAAAAKAERDRRGDASANPTADSLEKLARGQMTPAEIAALEARAEADAEAALAVELYRPLGAAAEERMAAAVLRENVVRLKPKPRRNILYLAAPPLAAAAALALFVGRVGRSEDVPDYALSFTTAAHTERGVPDGTTPLGSGPRLATELHPSSLLDIAVRPADAVNGAVEMRGALVRDGVARAWTPPVQISKDGAVRIVGRVSDILPPGVGSWDVVVAVGRVSALPTPADMLTVATGNESRKAGYRLVRGHIEVTPAP